MNIQYCGNCDVNISCVTYSLGLTALVLAFGMYLLSSCWIASTQESACLLL